MDWISNHSNINHLELSMGDTIWTPYTHGVHCPKRSHVKTYRLGIEGEDIQEHK